MLQLYDLNKNKISGLTKYKDLKIESTLSSGDKVLSFSYPRNLSRSIAEEGYIRTKTDEYVIKQIERNSDTYITVNCNLNLEELEGKVWESFSSKEQTIDSAIKLAIAGTGWTVKNNGVTKKRTIRKTGCSALAIIQQCIKTYRCEIEYDSINKIINVYKSIGNDKGCYFTDQLNLKELSIQSDSYNFYTIIEAYGKNDIHCTVENYQYSHKKKALYWKDERYTDIDSLREDATLKLAEISIPARAYKASIYDLARLSNKYKNILDYALGDTITLINKDTDTRLKQRIVKTVEYPDNPENNTVEISNTFATFEDIQKEQKETQETVSNITENNGTISLKAMQDGWIELNKVNVQELNAVKANIGKLDANEIIADMLHAHKADISDLKTGKADITDLTASNIKFGTAEGGTLDLQTLLSQFISGNQGQFLNLTGDNVVIANALIKDAMIDSINARKINAGTVDTSKVAIQSADGSLKLWGDLLQFKDKNGKVRIQMGLDGNKVYSLKILDANGNIQFDTSGVTKAGLNNGIIDDSKVADNANINGKKIDINSLITEINAGTTTLKASKIYLDTQKQTLETAFNTMSNTVTETSKATETNTTKIEEQQGQIDTLVKNTIITEDGKEVQLKDAYTALKQTVGEISQKATKVETNFNNMSIGTRNLIIGSSNYNPYVYKATGSGTNEQYVITDMYAYLENGKTYTFKCTVDGNYGADAKTDTVEVYFLKDKKLSSYLRMNDSTYTFTMSKESGNYYVRIDNNDNSKTHTWKEFICVEGNIAPADWTEAPEDVEERNNTNIGKTVASTVTEYYVSTSNTSCTGGSWSTDSPKWSAGKYLWARNKTILRNGTVQYSNCACIQGAKGETGSTGKGIKSVTAEYYMSTSKTSQTGGSWVTSCPQWQANHYLWTRSKITYTDDTTSYTTPMVDSSWEAVNYTKTGTINILSNTHNPQNTKHWSNVKIAASSQSIIHKENVFSLENSTLKETMASTERFKVNPNTQYVFQMKVYLYNVLNFDVHFLGRALESTKDYESVHTFISANTTTDYRIVYGTFTTADTDYEGYIRIDNNASKTDGQQSSVFFTDIMLAEGNKHGIYDVGSNEMEQRVWTAEQKITPTAIVNAINTALTDSSGNSKIDTVSTVLNKDGLTVKNGAFKIINKAGQTVLSANENNAGNLYINGVINAETDDSKGQRKAVVNTDVAPFMLDFWRNSLWKEDKAGTIVGIDLSYHTPFSASETFYNKISLFMDSNQNNYNYLYTAKPLYMSSGAFSKGDNTWLSDGIHNCAAIAIDSCLELAAPKDKNLGENGIFSGSKDGATWDGVNSKYNMAISSWYGLAFGTTCDWQSDGWGKMFRPASLLNCRTGEMYIEKGKKVLADVAHKYEAPGYIKLNNGLIIQWGSNWYKATSGQFLDTWLYYPIAFTSNAFMCVASVRTTNNNWGRIISTLRDSDTNKTRFRVVSNNWGSDYNGCIDWIAIGY